MASTDALASLLLDRFVSASSADDAHSSLERMLEALKANKTKQPDDNDTPTLAPDVIWSDPDVLQALRHVLHTGKHKQNDMEVPLDEGASLVCKIYMEMVDQESTKSQLLEKDDVLLECLIDVISSDPNKQLQDDEDADTLPVSMYTRVLALQLLTKLCVKRPSKAQRQLLQAPNGLHRLGELLQVDQEEIIRNEALLLAQVIAEWPSCAKIWMFDEVADQVMLLAMEEGGLTGGNLLVQDCLDLLFKLWKHDPNLADLVFQSQTITRFLPQLIDLRRGTEFLHPPSKVSKVKKDDDLDDILMSASSDKGAQDKQEETVLPRLKAGEEKVIEKTLDILALLLESDVLKQSVWKREVQLCVHAWELALVAPPPPQVPPFCAVPSPQLQQKALETLALYFNDREMMDRNGGLDRLLYQVCTGGFGSTLKEKMGISQAALHAIRKTISVESANQILMYTLAPPMSMEDDQNAQPPPTVVHKLLNTADENLTITEGVDPVRRKVFLTGSLGGLSLFLTDQTSREVMLRITLGSGAEQDDEDDVDVLSKTTKTSLVEKILNAIGTMEEAQNPEDAFLSMTLLRFLCHWAVDTPAVVQTILSSNQSGIVISALLGIKTKTQTNKKGVAVLGKLLLGLSMEYMGEEEKCGGWTRASIMELIAKKCGGVSKFTSSLEQFKSVNEFGDTMPWSVCNLEFKVWSQWFSNCVLLVRKRVVHELTGSGEGEEEETDDEGVGIAGDDSRGTSGGSSARSLQKVVYQQSKEIDELQQSLEKANATIKTQYHDLSEYKRRVESAPSQLDTMLNEYLAKIAELESSVANLEEKNRLAEEKHVSELKIRDDKIEVLEKDLAESKTREKEARDETESVREEIQSLSQAYNSLEQDYREQQQRRQESGVSSTEATTTTFEQQAGEQEQEGPQQHSVSTGAGSTEISTLRAENERLRNDAQAADQWMSMAVEKMNAMGQQNMGLQAELLALKDSQSQGASQQYMELSQQYQSLAAEKENLVNQLSQIQTSLDGASQENHELRGSMQQEREQYTELERQLVGSREELQSTVTALTESRSQAMANKADFDSQLEKYASELEVVSSEKARLLEQLNLLQQNSAEGDTQATVQAVADYQAALAAKEEEMANLRQSLTQLQGEVEIMRTEVENARRHGQEEIYQKESRIRELEAQLRSGTGSHGALPGDVIKEKDNEIKELVDANQKAQEWMEKAIEHHNMLSEQHTKLGAENYSLHATVRELKEKAAQNEAAVAQAKALQEESRAQGDRTREMEASLEACKMELGEAQAEIALLQNRNRELANSATEIEKLRDEIVGLKTSLEEMDNTCENARRELETEKESHAAAVSQLEALKLELSSAKGDSSSSEETEKLQQQIESLNASLMEKSEELKLLRSKIDVSSVSNQSSHSISQPAAGAPTTALDFFSSGSAQPETASVDANQFFASSAPNAGAQELFGASSSNELKAADVFATPGQPASGSTELASQLAEKVDEINKLQEQLKNARDELEETKKVAESSSAHQERISELESTVNNLQQQVRENEGAQTQTQGEENAASVDEVRQELEDTKEKLADALAKLEDDDSVIVKWEERVAELESAVKDLQHQLHEQEEHANSVIAKWQESCNNLEEKNAELVSSLESFGLGEDLISRDTVAALQERLEETEKELASAKEYMKNDDDVVLHWQERVAELEGAGKEFEAQMSQQELEAKTVIAKWQESNAELVKKAEDASESEAKLQEQLRETEQALDEAKARLEEDEDVVAKWQARVTELEAAVKELEEQLSEQEEDANNVISTWEQSTAALEEQKVALEQRLEVSAETEKTLEGQLQELRQSLDEATEKASQMETKANDLEKDLNEQEEEATITIAKWEESFKNLEEEKTELSQKLETSEEKLTSLQEELKQHQEALDGAKEDLQHDEVAVTKWQERVAALEAEVKDLEAQLNEQEEEANRVIAMWQESCTNLDSQKSELAQMLEESRASVETLNEQLQETQASLDEATKKLQVDEETIGNLKERTAELESTMEELRSQLTSQEEAKKAEIEELQQSLSNDEQVVERWQERVTELEAAVKDLEEQLSEQEEEANKVISTWQESYTALEKTNTELTQTIESRDEQEKSLGDNIAAMQQQLNQNEAMMSEWQANFSTLSAAKNEVTEALDKATAKQEATEKELESLQRKMQETESALTEAQTNLKDKEATVLSLEEQLQATRESADQEASQREQEALESLRAQVSTLQTKLDEQEAALKEARENLAYDETAVSAWEKRATELEATVKELEDQLTEQENEATNAISEWSERCSLLEQEKTELATALSSKGQSESKESLSSTSQAQQINDLTAALEAERVETSDLKEQVTELEATVNGLQHRLLVSEKEFSASREQFQESIDSYESQINEAQAKIEALEASIAQNATSATQSDKGQTEDEGWDDVDELDDVSLTQHDDEKQASSTTNQGPSSAESSARVKDLVTQVEQLEEQMTAKDKEMADSVLEWQKHCVALGDQNNELSSELDRVSQALAKARDRSDDPDFEGSPEEHILELESTIEALEHDLEESRKEAHDAIEEWQESYNALAAKNEALETHLASLSEEVQTLNETKESLDAELERYKSLEAEARDEVSNMRAKMEGSTGETNEDELRTELDDLKSKLKTTEASLAERELELQNRPPESALQELESKNEELTNLNTQLTEAIKERDAAVAITQEKDKLSSPNDEAGKNEDEKTITELTAMVETLEGRVEELKKERDSSASALESMKESSRSLVQELETVNSESENIVKQWTERTKELEEAVRDLEIQMEQQTAEATEVIGSWDARCSELQESLSGCQAELEGCKAELIDVLRTHESSLDNLLTTYDDADTPEGLNLDVDDVESLRTRCGELFASLEKLLAKQEDDVKALYIEMEILRTQIQEMDGDVQEGASVDLLRSQLEDLMKQLADKQTVIDDLKGSLASEENNASQLRSDNSTLEAKINEMEASIEKERSAKGELHGELEAKVEEAQQLETQRLAEEAKINELEAKVEKLESAMNAEELEKTSLKDELEAKVKELEAAVQEVQLEKGSVEGKLESLKESLDEATRQGRELKEKLEKSEAECQELRESLGNTVNTEASRNEDVEKELGVLRNEKTQLETEVERLSKLASGLEYDLEEANNAMQVYMTKEVSDKATTLAAQALREQLHAIRKQADADRAAYNAQKEAKMALEDEVQRLRADLYALVDVTDQENEMYGSHALTIKAADKINRKERREITEIRNSLTRALEELRTSRAAERDAEERAAKAAHHVVVCEEELVAAKSDLRYLIQTMDEMRQDEASRRASLEYRIQSLENDHDVLQRFHATETDSLRNELTQAVMEKDRALQLLKDSEKNKAAMLYAASREHTGNTGEPPEREIARLRIEKAQLLVAASDEGARTERRIREVVATELSSAETDILVERERRLAADAACENMKLLVAELQNDVQSYREESRRGRSPARAQLEREKDRLKEEIEKLVEESSSLRSQLITAQSAQENANYRIEKLTAECRMAQASSNRLDREIKFQSEIQAEMISMRSLPPVRATKEDDESKERKEDDAMATTVELYDRVTQQAEAMKLARKMHQELQKEHEDLLSLLAQTDQKRLHLEEALTEARGRSFVDVINRQSEESVLSQYGHCVQVAPS